jgi:hypothetical protein
MSCNSINYISPDPGKIVHNYGNMPSANILCGSLSMTDAGQMTGWPKEASITQNNALCVTSKTNPSTTCLLHVSS